MTARARGVVGLLLLAACSGSTGSTPPPIAAQPGSPTPDGSTAAPPIAGPPQGSPMTNDPKYAPPPPGQPGQPGMSTAAVPGPIAGALGSVPAAVSANYVFSLSEDRRELTIDPRPLPTRRARDMRGGFETKDSENGGKIVTLAGGPFRGGMWTRASFRQQVEADAQLAELRRSGYDVEQVRDLLVVDGEQDTSPTVFAFSADASKPGLVGICSQVTIVDFGPGANQRPIAVRKPVIYLYPEQTTDVRVNVEIDGTFTAVYPAMGSDGWRVTANRDGGLVDRATGRRHRYLFWEGTSAGFAIDPARAFCVAAADSAGFLERACDRYALTSEECGDFVTYWLPELAKHRYNMIQFVDESVYGNYARLTVEPRPDTVVRQFMIFRGSDVAVAVGSPELAQRVRRGFTVVEWGGAELGAGAVEIR